MKVFCLLVDFKRYQTVDHMHGFVEKHRPTNADAPIIENWEPLTGVVDNPTKRRGDFLLFGMEYFVCKREITEAFAGIVRDHVQVLPVGMEGESAAYDLWNIKSFVNALDHQKTKFKPPPFRSMPNEWAFKPDCFERPMLFRTPDVPSVPLAVTGFDTQFDEDFCVRYRELGLKGLKLELLWEGD